MPDYNTRVATVVYMQQDHAAWTKQLFHLLGHIAAHAALPSKEIIPPDLLAAVNTVIASTTEHTAGDDGAPRPLDPHETAFDPRCNVDIEGGRIVVWSENANLDALAVALQTVYQRFDFTSPISLSWSDVSTDPRVASGGGVLVIDDQGTWWTNTTLIEREMWTSRRNCKSGHSPLVGEYSAYKALVETLASSSADDPGVPALIAEARRLTAEQKADHQEPTADMATPAP